MGSTVVTWTVTDGSGNTTTATQTVTVTDNINPTITAPTDVIVCNGTTVSLGTPTTADNCSVASVTNDAPGFYPVGTTTVTWIVTDGSGNTATASQNVTVLPTSSSSQTVTLCAGQSITVGANTYTATNIYVDVLVGANSCDSTVTTDLTVNGAIDISTSIVGATITSNASAATYQWIDCNNANAIIPSEINQSYTAGSSGDYAVIVMAGSCSDTSACVNINMTGISESSFGTISVFPNPGKGLFTIQTSGNNTLSSYVVMDAKGSIILKGILSPSKTIINLLNVENGVYILNIETRFFKLMKLE